MKKLSKNILALGAALSIGFGFNTPVMAQETTQQVYRSGTQGTFEGSPQIFTGKVHVDMVLPSNDVNKYGAAYVTFAPRARSAWHTHPAGQSIIVIKGVCWTQTWNGVKTEAHPGDAIWCPVGVKHWHGASPDGEMTHLTLTGVKDGKNVEWMEHVTDEQYYSK